MKNEELDGYGLDEIHEVRKKLSEIYANMTASERKERYKQVMLELFGTETPANFTCAHE